MQESWPISSPLPSGVILTAAGPSEAAGRAAHCPTANVLPRLVLRGATPLVTSTGS